MKHRYIVLLAVFGIGLCLSIAYLHSAGHIDLTDYVRTMNSTLESLRNKFVVSKFVNLPPHAPPVNELNEAQLSEKWNNVTNTKRNGNGKLHLVTNILLITHKDFSKRAHYDEDNSKPATQEQLVERQQEIEQTLQTNLNNGLIAAVHVLYDHPAVQTYLRTLKLQNTSKLILHLTKRNPTVGMNLEYIQTYLMNNYVVLSHMDIALDEGWEKIDLERIRSERVMYAITRWDPCVPPTTKYAYTCNPGGFYGGSQDTFFWFIDKPFPETFFNETLHKVPPNTYGLEGLFIGYFRHKLGYKVINPCKQVKTHHNHCSNIRTGDKGISYGGDNGDENLAYFSDELY